MKAHYDKESDILMIELARKKIDDAYETKNMIVHVTKDREPVLLEIFQASKVVKGLDRLIPQKIAGIKRRLWVGGGHGTSPAVR